MYVSRRHNFLATVMVVVYGSVVGCSANTLGEHSASNKVVGLSNIKTIVLVTPDVRVVRQEIGGGPSPIETPVSEWEEKARRNIVRAMVKDFGKLFVIKSSDSSESADAILTVSASDEIKTGSRRIMDTLAFPLGSLLLPMLYVTVVPMLLLINPKGDIGHFNREMLKGMVPAGLMTINLELAKPLSRDILWSFTKESRGDYDLRDYANVESLIAEAVEDFSKKMSQSEATEP